jgi:hypothetical protein
VAGPWRDETRVTITAVDDTRVLVADRRHLLGAMDASAGIADAVERSVVWAQHHPVGGGARRPAREAAGLPSPA